MIALAGPAAGPASAPSADALLIQTVDAALTVRDQMSARPGLAAWQALDDDFADLAGFAAGLPATSLEGLAAKARLLKAQFPSEDPTSPNLDHGERVLLSLVADLLAWTDSVPAAAA